MSTASEIDQQNHSTLDAPVQKPQNWLLFSIYCVIVALGAVGGLVLQRLYYTHGGSLQWFQSGLQAIGSLVYIPQIIFFYFKTEQPSKLFFMDFKLFFWSVCIGVLFGLANYLASVGLSHLPLSTFSLLSSSQLAFTALFAFIIVKQKFTIYSLNAVIAITLGAVVLSLHSSSDRPSGVTVAKYLVGYILSIAAAALGGLTTPMFQLAYSQSSRTINYMIMMQFVLVIGISSFMFAVVGMHINKEFKAIPQEVKEFTLGTGKYYLIIVTTAISGQLSIFGSNGIVKCKSSLLAGIYIACLAPITQTVSIIIFHEKFTGDKALSMALCIWGFASYFIGEYRMSKSVQPPVESSLEDGISEEKVDLECRKPARMSGNSDKPTIHGV